MCSTTIANGTLQPSPGSAANPTRKQHCCLPFIEKQEMSGNIMSLNCYYSFESKLPRWALNLCRGKNESTNGCFWRNMLDCPPGSSIGPKGRALRCILR